jgi:hypothetical protein
MAENFKVTSQRQRMMLVGDTFVPSMEVAFTTVDGTPASINVPIASYSADAVKQAIEARVKDIEDVAAL